MKKYTRSVQQVDPGADIEPVTEYWLQILTSEEGALISEVDGFAVDAQANGLATSCRKQRLAVLFGQISFQDQLLGRPEPVLCHLIPHANGSDMTDHLATIEELLGRHCLKDRTVPTGRRTR